MDVLQTKIDVNYKENPGKAGKLFSGKLVELSLASIPRFTLTGHQFLYQGTVGTRGSRFHEE